MSSEEIPVVMFTQDQSDFIKSLYRIITSPDGVKYYHNPFYFEHISDNCFRMLNPDQLPEYVKDVIENKSK